MHQSSALVPIRLLLETRPIRLRNCTERSLLIIDEFGKGTNSVGQWGIFLPCMGDYWFRFIIADGAGLFVGLIKHLVTRSIRLPKTMLATHFHEVFFNDFLKRGLPIGLAHMELIIDRENPRIRGDQSEGKIVGVTPLFKWEHTRLFPLLLVLIEHCLPHRLAPGLCLKSYAFHCAESFGIATHIVERALAVSTAISSYNVHEIMDPQMTDQEEKDLVEAEQIVRRLLQVDWQDEFDDEGNQVSTLQKLAEVLGQEYTPTITT